MTNLTIEQIKTKATQLMNDYKAVKAASEACLSKLTALQQMEVMFYSEEETSVELVAMREFFRSFDDEFNESMVSSPSDFREPRGFTLEYRELAFNL